MKIAIISFYSGLIDRGVETWAQSVKENIDKKFDVVILTGEKFGKLINWQSKSTFYWTMLVLKHTLSTWTIWSKVDVIIPTNGGLQALFCRLVAWVYGKPVVIFGHAGLGADDKWNLLCMPDIFIVFSEEQKKWALKHKLPWTKVKKINHGVDLERFKPASKKPRKKVVLCVAADTTIKQINLVKAAVARLKGFKYLGVGKGNDLDVPFEKMPQIYKKADIFCFVPKISEAFGLVYLEALATNLPVVATDDPVRREIVGNAGLFVKNPENLELLASTIEKAYQIAWGDKPRKQAQKFSWENIALEYQDLLQQLVK